MKNKLSMLPKIKIIHKKCATCFMCLAFLSLPLMGLKAQDSSNLQPIDQIVAVVNSHLILKSDVDKQVAQDLYRARRRGQNASFSKQLWYSTLESMVQQQVLLDHARIDSVTATDAEVNQQIDQRINQAVSQAGGKAALEKQMGKSLVQIRAGMRKNFKQGLTIHKYRAQRMKKVKISRPEVKDYFKSISKSLIPTIPEKVAISQIVIIAPPKKDSVEKARHLAEQIRDSIVNYGKSFEAMAKKYSDGPAAPEGGEIPMYPINKLTPKYAAAASALKPGEISKVVRTPFGFHVIRLNKRRGKEIDTNNILIALGKGSYNTKEAIQTLNQIRDSVKNHETTFAKAAHTDSDDPNTAPLGGRIIQPNTNNSRNPGSSLWRLSDLAPSLHRIVLLLNHPGDVSKPEPFTLGTGNTQKQAYRIIRLDKHIPKHKANLKQDYQAIKRKALQVKRNKVYRQWINELEKDIFIEYKIPMPKKYKKMAQNK